MTPVDRLVTSIEQALTDGGAAVGGDRLAAEYAQWCTTANRRLEQCERLLAGKAEYEALQAAETAPPLLDLCAALSFEKAVTWRTTCQSKGWARPEELNERAIGALNELYAKGINTSHPLYRDYRRAIAEHDDTKALSVLKTIVRLNPSDANAQQEIQRLLGKVRTTTVARLDAAVQQRDEGGTLKLLEEIESESWTGAVSRPVLEYAQELRRRQEAAKALARCNGLVEWLDRLKDEGAWGEALTPVQEVEQLSAAHGLTLESDVDQMFVAVRDWARECKRQDDEEKEFQSALRNLEFLVEKGGVDGALSTDRSTSVLRAEQHSLISAWREVEAFSKPVAETLQTRVQRRNGVLQTEINRLTRQRRLLTTAGVVAFVATAGIAAVLMFRWQWTKGQIADLVVLREARKVGVAEKLVSDLRGKLGKALPAARLTLALQETEEWAAGERRQLELLGSMLEKLRAQRQSEFKNVSVDDILRDLDQARNHAKELAPEFRSVGTAELLEFEAAFDSTLQKRQQQLQADFQAVLKEAEEQAAIFDRTDLTVTELRRSATALADSLARLESAVKPIHERLRVPDSLTGRVVPLRVKLVPYQQALDRLDAAEAEVRQATTLEQYYAALEKFDSEHLRQLPAVRDARRVVGAKVTASEVERLLLSPDDKGRWLALQKRPVSPLPAEVMPTELSKWLSLRDDENLQNVYFYQIPPTEGGSAICTPPARDGRIYTRGPWRRVQVDSLGLRFKATAFIVTKDSTRADFQDADFVCQCSATTPLRESELNRLGGLCPESGIIKRIDLDTWINDAGDKFRLPLLQLLDELRAVDGVSPLFKAYLHWRLLEIAAVRPEAWGVQNAPAVERDRVALRELGVADLRSGDWMVPVRVKQYETKIREFYRQSGTVSYAKQARFIEQLLADAHTAGFRFVGYVATDGSPRLSPDGTKTRRLWGLNEENLSPTLLWATQAASENIKPITKPQAFTPLFACGCEVDDLLKTAAEKVKVDWRSLGITQLLPPLFREEKK
jgi:ribosomal protein S18 acetylase RimI-like enzyme